MGTTKHRGVIAIDPGKSTGWAIFLDGALVEAGVKADEKLLVEPPEVAIAPAVLVIELPRIYPTGKGVGDPNQLIDLTVQVGDLRGFYSRAGYDTVLVWPRTWKGTVPKEIHNNRVINALKEQEKQLLPKKRTGSLDHNMVDAVGLGLWLLGTEMQR